MNDMRKLMETVERLDEATEYGLLNDEVEKHMKQAAQALYVDVRGQAAGVYDEEGPGKSGAMSKSDYVAYATKIFLTPVYMKEVVEAFREMYADVIEETTDAQLSDGSGYGDSGMKGTQAYKELERKSKGLD